MKNTQHSSKYQQLGVTLIELMVAMAISSVIMLGISNIYLSTKKSYVLHDEFSRIQENARYAIETLSSNIRNAGFFGCSSGQGLGKISNTLKQTAPPVPVNNFETGLMGYEAVGSDTDEATAAAPLIITPEVNNGVATDWVTAANQTVKDPAGGADIAFPVNPDAAIVRLAIKGSDILVIRTAAGSGLTIGKNNNGAQFFAISQTGADPVNNCLGDVCQDDILLVSDCTKSMIFQLSNMPNAASNSCPGLTAPAKCVNFVHSNAANTPGNVTPTWDANNQFGPGSEIMTVVTKTYFIGVNPNPAAGETLVTEPSLYVRINNGVPQPLVEGIENMQVLYGVDSDNDGTPNRYFSANDVVEADQDGDATTIFDGVVSVKISLLVRTPNNLPGLTRTAADYAGLTYALISPAASINIDPVAAANAAATDRRMRKVFNLTIKIRNKSFKIAN